METTIEQIANKLDPSPYVDSATEWAKEKTENINAESLREGAQKVGEGVKNNPVPLALAGLTLASLYFTRKRSGENSDSASEQNQSSDLEESARARTSIGINAPAYEDPNFNKILAEVEDQHAIQEATRRGEADNNSSSSSLQETMQEWKNAVGEKANAASSKFAQAQEKGRTVLRNTGTAAKEKSKQWKDQSVQRFESGKNNSPILLGLGAVAVGFVAALALPRTRKENEFYGDSSDKLKKKAGEKRDKFTEDLRDKVHEKGLDPESLESRACEAVDEAANNIVGKMDETIPPSN